MIEQPGEGYLVGRRADLARYAVDGGHIGEVARVDGVPGDEGLVGLLTVVKHRFPFPVILAIFILYRHDVDVFLRLFYLLHTHFGKPDVFDQSFFLDALQEFQGTLKGDGGVDAVQLIQMDLVLFEAGQAAFEGFPEVFGTGIDVPLIGARPQETALCGDDQSFRIRIEGFRDQVFRYVGPVAVGVVDEVDAQFDGAPEDADGFGLVFGGPPDALAGDAHSAESHAADL